MILTSSDFSKGLAKIAGSLSNPSTTADLETYFTAQKENAYIRRILGYTLGNEFIADLAGTPLIPQDAKFTTIFNGFNFEVSTRAFDCIGLKEILIYLIYNDFVSQQNIQNQFGGNKSIRSEASSNEGITGKTTVIYNRAANQIDTLQYYILNNSDTYTDFSGEMFEYQSGL